MEFGPRFIQWIKILYQDTISRILINGYISYDFKLTRGVRQGCPLSAYAYAVYLEALDIAINLARDIIALPIRGRPGPKTLLYADDLNLVLSDETNIATVFNIFERFEKATGSTFPYLNSF